MTEGFFFPPKKSEPEIKIPKCGTSSKSKVILVESYINIYIYIFVVQMS